MSHWLDEGELVHVGALASGRRPEAVLASVDVAALAGVVARLETATSAVEAAAVAVLELGHRRPFGDVSTAAAWLAAAHLLSLDSLRLRIGPIGAAGVLAAAPRLEVDDVVAVLVEHTARRPGRWRRALGPLVEPSWPDGPSVLPCPACGRPVVRRRRDLVAAGAWTSGALAERVARCAVRHQGHDRWAPQLVSV